MRFEEVSRVSHPASLVLETMMERLEEVVPFLPNVESIETHEVRKTRGCVHIVRRWQGAADSVPGALRPFISRDLLAWVDTAKWEPERHLVAWKQSTISPAMARLYDCSGVNYFEPDPEQPRTHTRIRITGELQVHPHELPGVPRLIGARLAPQIEKFVIGLITPNLIDLAKGLQGFLDAQAGAARKRAK